MHRLVGADARHSQALDVKFDRQFAGPQRVHDELRLITDKCIDNDLYFAVLRSHVIQFVTVFSRRQVQLQPSYKYRVDMCRSAKKLTNSKMKPEFAYANNWLEARFVIVWVGFSENSEAGAGDEKSLYERNMKGVQFNSAFESCR